MTSKYIALPNVRKKHLILVLERIYAFFSSGDYGGDNSYLVNPLYLRKGTTEAALPESEKKMAAVIHVNVANKARTLSGWVILSF